MPPAAALTDAATQYCVQAFEALHPRRPEGEAEALELLRRAAWQVQPIMKRRQWRVAVLRELEPENMTRGAASLRAAPQRRTNMPTRCGFCNAQPRLERLARAFLHAPAAGDNMNRGERVRIKVRRRGGGFEPYETILKVMLHELCHNEHGPHSASFYKLLDDITQECEALMAKGQGGTGAGFDAAGEKLGHRGGWGVMPADPAAAARDAALRRARHAGVMGGGGRLGGGGGGGAGAAGMTPQQAAAAAALRRAAAERFSKEHGLEDDAVEEEGAAGAAQQQQPAALPPPQAQASRAQPPPRPPAAAPPPQRVRLAFGRPPCVCGACGEAAPGGAAAGGSRALPQQHAVGCPERAAAAVGASADVPIVLLDDDDDDDDDVVVVSPAPARQQRVAGAAAAACWLCAAPASRCVCWSCAGCTRRNAAAAARCGACDAWRYARPPARP
jgi:hypothetical protein